MPGHWNGAKERHRRGGRVLRCPDPLIQPCPEATRRFGPREVLCGEGITVETWFQPNSVILWPALSIWKGKAEDRWTGNSFLYPGTEPPNHHFHHYWVQFWASPAWLSHYCTFLVSYRTQLHSLNSLYYFVWFFLLRSRILGGIPVVDYVKHAVSLFYFAMLWFIFKIERAIIEKIFLHSFSSWNCLPFFPLWSESWISQSSHNVTGSLTQETTHFFRMFSH